MPAPLATVYERPEPRPCNRRGAAYSYGVTQPRVTLPGGVGESAVTGSATTRSDPVPRPGYIKDRSARAKAYAEWLKPQIQAAYARALQESA